MNAYNLSFASRYRNGTINYWNTPDRGVDLAGEGRRRADELGSLIRESRNAAILLPFVASAISERGNFGPMETSFFHRCAELTA